MLLGVQLTQNRTPFSRTCRATEEIPSSKVPENQGKAEPSSKFWFRHGFLPHKAQSCSGVVADSSGDHFLDTDRREWRGQPDSCLMSPRSV